MPIHLVEELKKEPALAYKLAVEFEGQPAEGRQARLASQAVQASSQVQDLLGECRARFEDLHPYKKWVGPHWVLAQLADLGYPSGDGSLQPLMEKSYSWLLSEAHRQGIQEIDSRVRRCASQESNAVFYSLRLGLADHRTDELADRLVRWQWPDGGWNCDRRPEVVISSFMESLLPLRALALFANCAGDRRAGLAAEKAAEIFLKRQLFLRLRDGQVMDQDFLRLHYPCYWHYDILFALRVLSEAGFIHDPRCGPALDLLESKQLADGGYPSEAAYYRCSKPDISGYSPVSWGGIRKKTMNYYVTMDALIVLKRAGRI